MVASPDKKAFKQLFQDFKHGGGAWWISYGDGEGTNGHRAVSFLHAAEVVQQEMLMKGSNLAFFPMFFMLRQSIELSLKDSIAKMELIHGVTAPKGLWTTHNLETLARDYEPVVRLLHKNGETNTADEWPTHKAFLLLWQKADPDGVFLRYARTKDGGVSDANDGLGFDCKRPWESGREAARYISFNEDWLDEQGWYASMP